MSYKLFNAKQWWYTWMDIYSAYYFTFNCLRIQNNNHVLSIPCPQKVHVSITNKDHYVPHRYLSHDLKCKAICGSWDRRCRRWTQHTSTRGYWSSDTFHPPHCINAFVIQPPASFIRLGDFGGNRRSTC